MPHRHIQYPNSWVNALLRITSVIHSVRWGPGLIQRYPVRKEAVAICIMELEGYPAGRTPRGPKHCGGIGDRRGHSTACEKIIVDPGDLHATVRIGNIPLGGSSV